MEKTLQQQYNLIKEGKGSKDDFLKSARRVFPEYISSLTDYNSAVNILKGKSILSEGVGGIATQNSNKPDWFKIFSENLSSSSDTPKNKIIAQLLGPDFFLAKKPESQWDDKDHDLFNRIFKMASEEGKVPKLNEAVGVKDKEEYGDQNTFKVSKETEETLNHQFDNKDEKNIDNVYGQSFLMGYYTEMKDPKNADKTVDELKAIVLKNMVKDINYYHKEASFGVKGIGYTSEAPGAGIPKEPKGKFKSSGYGDMPKKTVKEGLNENKRPNVSSEIKEIEKANEALALEAKLNAIDEAIEKRKSKLALAESEELAEMIDQSMVKTLNKEIKELERHKAKTQKIYEKMTGKAKKEVIDEELDENNITEYEEDEFDRSPEMYGRGKSPREGKDMNYNEALKLAKAISREGVVQHVNELPDGSYEISDWYDADTTVISFENGIEI